MNLEKSVTVGSRALSLRYSLQNDDINKVNGLVSGFFVVCSSNSGEVSYYCVFLMES